MQYVILGRTGIRVARVALGALGFGNEEWGADRAESARILDAYADAGGNFLDTAAAYGNGESERVVGELLAARDRDRFVLATKFGFSTDSANPNSAGNHRVSLRMSIRQSLERLRTDRVDLLWVHVRDTWTPVEELMRALDDLVREGTVLQLGASNWPAWEVSEANAIARARGWTPFAAIQCRYNFVDRTAERDLLPMARAHEITPTIWSPLAGGLLTGRYPDQGTPGRPDTPPVAQLPQRTRAIMGGLDAIAARSGVSAAQIAVAWLLSRRPAVLPIVGATAAGHVADAVAALDVELGDDLLREIDALTAFDLGTPHDFLLQRRHATYGPLHTAVVDAGNGRWRGAADDDLFGRAGD